MRWGVLVILAGCDKLLGLTTITPPTFVDSGPATVAAGNSHTCWIRSDGALFCWGANLSGQLGLASSVVENDAPSRVGDGTWSAVSANEDSTCAIDHAGSLWCWGDNSNGQLATGDTMQRTLPTQVLPGTRWRAVSVSYTHACGLRDDDSLWCWGSNTDGALGDGTIAAATDPPTPPEKIDQGYVAIAVGTYHTCAIRSDHTLACWGVGVQGQLGSGDFANEPTPTTAGTDQWSQVIAGRYHTCGITQTGHLRCWGAQYAGQLGTGGTSTANAPAAVFANGVDGTDWLGVAASQRHTCAWTADAAYCFGDSSHGELGANGVGINLAPIAFPGGPWTALAVGTHHTCGTDTAGALWCVGAAGNGQLGTPNTSQLAPEPVLSSEVWSLAFVGHTASCAMNNGGHYACAGDNFSGQLGTGDHTSRESLGAVSGVNWHRLTVGEDYACGTGATDQLYCWGANDSGQLGNGTYLQAASPQQIALPGSGTVALEVHAREHTCARDGSGHLYCWGKNDHGQLAVAASAPVPSPAAQIAVPANFSDSLAVGYEFTCAIDDPGNVGNGPVYCWGRNDVGQLGDGTTIDRATPRPVGDGTFAKTFVKVWAGGEHACALEANGTAWCWGYNGAGELGIGGYGVQLVPAQVTGQWQAMALGYYFTCAIGTDVAGKPLWCWGDNRRGELGLNDPSGQYVAIPTRVGSDRWISIGAGNFHTCGIDASNQLACWGSNDDGALLDGKGWTATLSQVPTP